MNEIPKDLGRPLTLRWTQASTNPRAAPLDDLPLGPSTHLASGHFRARKYLAPAPRGGANGLEAPTTAEYGPATWFADSRIPV